MSDFSANLGLPFILASQAQKHITHNEALQRLDMLVQLRFVEIEATAPPAAPEPGETWALGPSATGDWAGQGGAIATWNGTAWEFASPETGWHGWDMANNQLLVWDGQTWAEAQALDNIDKLGINTTADTTNRLAVSGPASIFTHDGTDHRFSINKASTSDTASLLFQSSFTGHAEIGLTGTNDASFKVSPDGALWTEALVIDATTGLPSGEMIQNMATDVTPGRLARADYAYCPGNLLGTVSATAGTPTGAVIERGNNANGHYVRFADGTQICRHTAGSALNANTPVGALYKSTTPYSWTYPAAFSAAPYTAVAPRNTNPLWGRASIPNATSVSVELLSTFQTAAAFNIELFAFGRWF